MGPRMLVIGNSDGIGLATTRRLLGMDVVVDGLSKRQSPVEHRNYRHRVCDVRAAEYEAVLKELHGERAYDAVIYCAGIGRDFDPLDLGGERATFEVNLLGLVRAC